MSRILKSEDVIDIINNSPGAFRNDANRLSIIEAIQSLPQESKEQWISVSEKEPPHGIVVLLFRYGGYSVGYWHDVFDFVIDGVTHATGITHWQPLPPAPPKQ